MLGLSSLIREYPQLSLTSQKNDRERLYGYQNRARKKNGIKSSLGYVVKSSYAKFHLFSRRK